MFLGACQEIFLWSLFPLLRNHFEQQMHPCFGPHSIMSTWGSWVGRSSRFGVRGPWGGHQASVPCQLAKSRSHRKCPVRAHQGTGSMHQPLLLCPLPMAAGRGWTYQKIKQLLFLYRCDLEASMLAFCPSHCVFLHTKTCSWKWVGNSGCCKLVLKMRRNGPLGKMKPIKALSYLCHRLHGRNTLG